MKLRKSILTIIIILTMTTGNIPVWAAPTVSPLPAPAGSAIDVTFVSRMPVLPYYTGGIADETLTGLPLNSTVNKNDLTSTALKNLAPDDIVNYAGKDYKFVGWYTHSTVGDYYDAPTSHAIGLLPAIDEGDLYGVLRPWNFATDKVTLENTVADYNTAHTNRTLYLYAKWVEKDAHPNTVRYHLTDATGTPPAEHGVNVGGDWSTTARAITVGTVGPAGKVFAGWSTSEYRKPGGDLVLEIKVGDRIDARDEGADLYSVWLAPAAEVNSVTVDFSKTYQTMVGVGASWAFHKWNNFKYVYDLFKAQGIGDSDNLGLKAVKRYIDEEEGVGMDIVRLIIGDGGVINTISPDAFAGSGTAPFGAPSYKNTISGNLTWGDHIYDGANDTIWPTPPAFDGDLSGIIWNTPGYDPATYKQYGREGFGEELFDEDQIWFAKKAIDINPDVKIYASLWSPPYWMKSNQNVRNDYWWNPMGNPKDDYPMLLEKYYDEFAIYLAEYALGMMKYYDVPIYALCPTNETEIAHGYSGYVFQGDNYQRFLKDYLYPVWEQYQPEFTAVYGSKGLPNPKLSAPEGTRMDRSTSPVDMGTTDRPGYGAMMSDENIFNNPTAPNSNVSIFSTHLYEYNQYEYEARKAADLTNTNPDLEDPYHPSYLRNYDDIWMAEMGTSGANYGFGTARFLGNLFGSDPGFTSVMWWWPAQTLSNGGNIRTSQPYTGQMNLNKAYYISGQFSRFINDGYVRADVDNMYPFEGANITAYKDGSDFVIVALNETATAKNITFNLSNIGSPSTVTPYRTSLNENIKRLSDIPVTGGSFNAALPAYSVTSFVYHQVAADYPVSLGHHILADTLYAAENDGTTGTVTPAGNALNFQSGSSVAFKNFNFGDGTAGTDFMTTVPHVARIVAKGLTSATGGNIAVRVGDTAGKIVATIKVPAAASNAEASAMVDTGDKGAYGFNDLYMTFDAGITVNSFSFDGTQLPVAFQLLAVNGQNPAAAWTGAGAALSSSTEASYQPMYFGFFPTPTVRVDARTSSGGAVQALTGALSDGSSYNFKCQIITANKSLAGAARPDASVVLASYNGNTLVSSQTIAARADIWAVDWSQVDGSFVYAKPAAAYDRQQIEIRLSGTEVFYIAAASLVSAEGNPPASSVSLNSLFVSPGALSPAFSPLTTKYAVTVANNVSSVTVYATSYNTGAVVEGAGAKTLNVGNNKFTLKVTAADGTIGVYEVAVTRLPETTYTVTYDANGGNGRVTDSAIYLSGASVTVKDATGLTRQGYQFAGWNTAANGSGTTYASNATFVIRANTTLYAQWSAVTPQTTYTVTYNANGGNGRVTDSAIYPSGASVTVKDATGLTRQGYQFTGWNTAANGSGTTYAPNAIFVIRANTTLYAQWSAVTPQTSYTVTYNANGGNGRVTDSAIYPSGASVTVKDASGLTRQGYQFTGWNTAANGSGTAYNPNATFVIRANTTLYAQWSAVSAPGSGAGGGSSSGNGSVPGVQPGGSQPGSTSPGTTQPGSSLPSTDSGGTPTRSADFSDAMSVSPWATEFLDKLITMGVMNGYADGTLKPKGNVTRAEFTKMIVTALNLSGGSGSSSFGDVGAADWFKQFVDIASSRGLINGIGGGLFAPNAQISRQDLCVIVYRALQDQGAALPAEKGAAFADDGQIAAYAKDAVYALRQMGIVSGRDTGSFDPAAPATREETAKIICGVVDFIAANQATSQTAVAPAVEAPADTATTEAAVTTGAV